MKKALVLLLGISLSLMLLSCQALQHKTNFRIGAPNRPEAMAPLFYNNYLPKQYRTDVMVLNAPEELKTALLVEAVDLAVLPVRVILEEHEQTNQFIILASVAVPAVVENHEDTLLALVCKKNLLKKYPAALKALLGAHQQASQYLNTHQAAWQQEAVDQDLNAESSQLVINNTELTWALNGSFKNAVREEGKAMVKNHDLPAEPNYATLWP